MKANELQIGDWLMTSSGMPRRVMELSGIVEDYIILEDGTESGFHPIPLTAEILEKNGLYECLEFYDGWNFELTDGKKTVISGGPIWFVHELQHALRLCGLTELGNNFKI